MKTQEELTQGLEELALSIAEQENATQLVAGTQGQKPRWLTDPTRIDYKQLVEASEWEDKLAIADANLVEASRKIEEGLNRVFAMIPASVVEVLKQGKVPVFAGEEGVKIYALYFTSGKPKVLVGQYEHPIYSSIYASFQQQNIGVPSIQSMLNSIYS